MKGWHIVSALRLREPRGFLHFHRVVEEQVMDIMSRFSGNGNGCLVEESPGTAVPGLSGANGEGDGAKAGRERARNGERDDSGRFVAGNKGGPGNPYSRRVAQLKMWLAEVVDEAGIKAVGMKLLAMATAGQVAAARVLFQYVMPKQVEPDRMDVEEWELIKEGSKMFAEMPALITKPSPEFSLELVRAMMVEQTDRIRGMTVNALRTPQNKVEEVLGMLKRDPEKASEYLKKGPDEFFGKGKARKAGRGRARNGGGKPRKR